MILKNITKNLVVLILVVKIVLYPKDHIKKLIIFMKINHNLICKKLIVEITLV